MVFYRQKILSAILVSKYSKILPFAKNEPGTINRTRFARCVNSKSAARSWNGRSNLLMQQRRTRCSRLQSEVYFPIEVRQGFARKTARHVSARAYRIEGIPRVPSENLFDRKETSRGSANTCDCLLTSFLAHWRRRNGAQLRCSGNKCRRFYSSPVFEPRSSRWILKKNEISN